MARRRFACGRRPAASPAASAHHDDFKADPRRVRPGLAPAKADPRADPTSYYAFRSEKTSSRRSGDAEPNAISDPNSRSAQGLARRMLAVERSMFDGLLKIAGRRKTRYIKA